MMENKRKICFVITSFIHYSRNLLILNELNNREDVDLHIIVGGAALIAKYTSKHAKTVELLKEDGLENIYEAYFNLEGDNNVTKAKTAGLGIIEFANLFNNIKPDLVVVRADRFEVLSAATAASHMNIPIAHIEGGDVSGTLDEAIRHSITKLSHIHFATNEPAKNRIIKMGENPEYVFNFGSPDIEVVHKFADTQENFNIDDTGSGSHLREGEDYIMVMYHPVSIIKMSQQKRNTEDLLQIIKEINIPTIWFWPNFDLGSEEISMALREFNDKEKKHKIRFMRYMHPKKFIQLLKKTKCLVGNSSAGIKECSYLGIPVVNIGTRQNGRLRAENVLDISGDKTKLKEAILKQISTGYYNPSDEYYSDYTSKNIAEKLATVNLYVQKKFNDK